MAKNSKIPESLKKSIEEDGFSVTDCCWKHKQSGEWLVAHWYVQHYARKRGVTVEYEVVEIDSKARIATILAKGFRQRASGELTTFQSFGEASPANCTMGYHVAMAEKRGFDRTVLALAGWEEIYGSSEFASQPKNVLNVTEQATADPPPVASRPPKPQPEHEKTYSPRELGKMVREARGSVGQKTFAEKAGITVSELAKVEGGQACLSMEQVMRLSAKTNIPSTTLMGVKTS